MPRFETFDEWEKAVEKRTAAAWQANESRLDANPWDRPGLGVDETLRGDDDGDDEEAHGLRLDLFRRLMDFLWAAGPNPIQALQRLFVLTRCCSPQHLLWMNQSDVAVLLNETRAATSARELKVWREFMVARGFFAGTRRPLMKGERAKEAYAQAAKGNRNRKGGKAAIRKYSVLRKEAAKAGKPSSKRKSRSNPIPQHNPPSPASL